MLRQNLQPLHRRVRRSVDQPHMGLRFPPGLRDVEDLLAVA